MNDRTVALIANLREAAAIIRAGRDVHSDYFSKASEFSLEIERLADLVERRLNSPWAYIRAYIARKKAKYTWCAPTFDLDDYLTGNIDAAELGNAIYESL